MFLANFLIALREGVEAALLVGILVAYVVKVGRRDVLPKMWVGVIIAAALPLAAGAYMTWGPYTLTFQAQEILGGALSILAAVLVTWMMLWMSSHAAQLSTQVSHQAKEALTKGGWAFVWLAVLSVGREGIETAIFVMGTVKSATGWAPVAGVAAGIAVACVIGWAIYAGAAHINLRAFFAVTGALLLIVAAGIFSYGIGDLQEASVLPGWGNYFWDLSGSFDQGGFLSTTAWWYVLAEALVNFSIQPTWGQAIAWFAYMAVAAPLFLYVQFLRPRRAQNGEPPAVTPDASLPSLKERTLYDTSSIDDRGGGSGSSRAHQRVWSYREKRRR